MHTGIPECLVHLPVDPRWHLPRPYTTLDCLGTENNRLRLECAIKRLCPVCGRPAGDRVAFLCGPGELYDRALHDGAMHESCADAATRLCPHLARAGRYNRTWVMLTLGADEYVFQTADPARVRGANRGLDDEDEKAGVWKPGAAAACEQPLVRWRIRPGYLFTPDTLRTFCYAEDGMLREVALADAGEYDSDASEMLAELISGRDGQGGPSTR